MRRSIYWTNPDGRTCVAHFEPRAIAYTDGIAYGNPPVGEPMSEENQDKTTAEATPEQKPAPKKLLQKEPPITVGRVVHYQQHGDADVHMAHVCKVWGGETVNLDVVDSNGHHYTRTSVTKGTGTGQWRYPARSES